MADPSFIQDLPLTTQIVVNVAIGIITVIVGLKSYYSGKKETKTPTETIVTTTSNKFLEQLEETVETMSNDVSRIANSLESIDKHFQNKAKQDEIDREVFRITGKQKRGSVRRIPVEPVDKPE